MHNIPLVLYKNLVWRSEISLEEFIQVCRKCLFKTTLETLHCTELQDLPAMKELLEAILLKPSKYFEELQLQNNQLLESNVEQNAVFECIKAER